MVINDTRHKNLQFLHLKSKHSGVKQKDFARTIGFTPNVLNQYLTRHRNIGNQAARRIEGKLHLGDGWMDQPNTMEWDEMMNGTFDGFAPRSMHTTRNGLAIASRLDALTDEEYDYMVKTLTIVEQAHAKNLPPIQHMPRPKKLS